jgi:hypothetical protein
LYIKICSSIYRISGNSFNDGPAPPPQPSPPSANTPPLTTPPAVPSSTDSNDSQAEDHVKHSKLGGAGIVICLLVFGALVAFLVIKRNSWRISRGQDPEQNEPLSPLASGLKRKSLGYLFSSYH